MKKKKIKLFLFIDAFGWKILEGHPQFLEDLIPHKKKLKTILGYSNGCDPSIISGRKPSEHLHWSSFYYSPDTSEYQWTRILALIPGFLTSRSRIRGYLSRLIKWVHGYSGYFQIYQVPFKYLSLFDYGEKKRIWTKGGLTRGATIFDELIRQEIPHYVGDQDSEDLQVKKVIDLINKKEISFAYLLFGKLDAVMHAYGTNHEEVEKTIAYLEDKLRAVIDAAKHNYEEVDYYLFSDHGMHNITKTYDLQKIINQTGLYFGKDYVAFYDSTMARFWYLNDLAKEKILSSLKSCSEGEVLSDQELQKQGVFFPDHQYGETIFLMNSGVLIIPSFMGLNKIPGMHGYHPDDEDSYAMIASNRPVPENLMSIEQIYQLMKSNTEKADNQVYTPSKEEKSCVN